MSRPFRTLFALCLVAFSVGLSGCDTIYRPVYSNQKNYFKPNDTLANAKGQSQLSAEQVLQQTDATGASAPAPMAAPDAGAMPPAAPPAGADAMPAVPPAAPPPPQ